LRRTHRRRRAAALASVAVVVCVAAGAWTSLGGGNQRRVPVDRALQQPKAASPVKLPVKTNHLPMPKLVRGVHISLGIAANPARMSQFMDLTSKGLNTLEIDVKDENGEVAGLEQYTPKLADRYHATREYYDLAHIVRIAHERHIWVVARIVSFKDPIVAEADKGIAIHTASGSVWHDGGGVPWLNQYSPGAWRYLIDLAKGAARTGVDEVQFDYVRFPSEGDLGAMRWPHKKAEPKNATIPRFLTAVRSALKPFPVKIGVDLFGLAADHDLGIGQDVSLIAKHVDVISPMLYPNHFGAGELGIQDPNGDPNGTVALSMGRFRSKIINSPNVKIRPWLQDFGGYSAADVQAQVSAAMHQGAVGWMLWNASVVYNWNVFGPQAS
jgi:hypothetical protein